MQAGRADDPLESVAQVAIVEANVLEITRSRDVGGPLIDRLESYHSGVPEVLVAVDIGVGQLVHGGAEIARIRVDALHGIVGQRIADRKVGAHSGVEMSHSRSVQVCLAVLSVLVRRGRGGGGSVLVRRGRGGGGSVGTVMSRAMAFTMMLAAAVLDGAVAMALSMIFAAALMPAHCIVPGAVASSALAVHSTHGAGFAVMVATRTTRGVMSQHRRFIGRSHALKAWRAGNDLSGLHLRIGRVDGLGVGGGGQSEGDGEG
ncbi:hypothetical protein BH23BAC4_BH23BAC4_06060 [soil metagenome]